MLYSFDISAMSDADFLRMYESSDKSRKLKIDRLQGEPAKKLSAAAGMLARRGIAQWFGIDPREISFRCEKNGKPYAEGRSIHFSLSHSGSLAVCAVSDKPVGIDAEKLRPVNLRVAKKWFTAKEQDYVFSDQQRARERFFEIWTKKEAYVKRLGAGVSDFQAFDVTEDDSVYTVRSGEYVVAVSVTDEREPLR